MTYFQAFRYRVDFHKTTLDSADNTGKAIVCSGAFSEVSGLEASMEAFSFSEGGRNWGQHQRAGKTTFATLVLKRGMTADRGLWTWFQGVASGAYAYRLNATLVMLGGGQALDDAKGVLAWEFANCLPVKLKAADMNATSSDIALEELHLNHEGMTLAGATP